MKRDPSNCTSWLPWPAKALATPINNLAARALGNKEIPPFVSQLNSYRNTPVCESGE